MTEVPPRTVCQVPKSEGSPAYDAHDLLAGGRVAQIVLDDQVYVLRLTRAEKLILTK
ncbi:MAG: hemin uptake protein HemP [Pseudomonadota bacterium]